MVLDGQKRSGVWLGRWPPSFFPVGLCFLWLKPIRSRLNERPPSRLGQCDLRGTSESVVRRYRARVSWVFVQSSLHKLSLFLSDSPPILYHDRNSSGNLSLTIISQSCSYRGSLRGTFGNLWLCVVCGNPRRFEFSVKFRRTFRCNYYELQVFPW